MIVTGGTRERSRPVSLFCAKSDQNAVGELTVNEKTGDNSDMPADPDS